MNKFPKNIKHTLMSACCHRLRGVFRIFCFRYIRLIEGVEHQELCNGMKGNNDMCLLPL